MKLVTVLMISLALTACGKPPVIIVEGEPGPQGVAGQDGRDGVDATPVSVVTFCPGVTVYPSAFLEVGLIIGDKLYGVYSANGGFLTELPPGRYRSNAIGSACDFTVNADLTISY